MGIDLPPQINHVVDMGSATHLPEILDSGTVYIFDESISIDQDYHVQVSILSERHSIPRDDAFFETICVRQNSNRSRRQVRGLVPDDRRKR